VAETVLPKLGVMSPSASRLNNQSLFSMATPAK
jgi:hypothetical protein